MNIELLYNALAKIISNKENLQVSFIVERKVEHKEEGM